MTNPTLERAARAVCELHGGDYWDKAVPYERGRYRDVARAVLMAVREPDEAMKMASFEASGDALVEAWPAMIDAIIGDNDDNL